MKLECVALEEGAGGAGELVRACARCRAELGRIINRGALCKMCKLRVCKSCREYFTAATTAPTEWLCTACYKNNEFQIADSDWITDYVRCSAPKLLAGSRISNIHSIKNCVQRSFTFSDTKPSRWAALRGSPELRAYSSMPRHQDGDYAPSVFRRRNKCSMIKAENEQIKPEPTVERCPVNMKDENSVLKTDTPSTADDSAETNDENSPVNFIKIVDSCGLVLDIPAVATSDELIVDDSEQSNAQTNNEIPQPSASTKMTKVYRKKSTGSLKSSFLDSLSNRVQEVTRRRKAIDFRNLPPGVTPPRSRRFKHPEEGDATLDPVAQVLFPDSDDYRLVFISSSDSSSREELPYGSASEDEKSSTSSLVHPSLEDGDWDYFEDPPPGSAIGSFSAAAPDRASTVAERAAFPATAPEFSFVSSLLSCASPVQPLVVPVPIPIPILVPVPWNPELTIRVEHGVSPALRTLFQQNWSEYVRGFGAVTGSPAPSSGGPAQSAVQCDEGVSGGDAPPVSDEMDLPDVCPEHDASRKKFATLPLSELRSVGEILSKKPVAEDQTDDAGEIVLKKYQVIEDAADHSPDPVSLNNIINKQLTSEFSVSDSDASDNEENSVQRIYNLHKSADSEDSESSAEDDIEEEKTHDLVSLSNLDASPGVETLMSDVSNVTELSQDSLNPPDQTQMPPSSINNKVKSRSKISPKISARLDKFNQVDQSAADSNGKMTVAKKIEKSFVAGMTEKLSKSDESESKSELVSRNTSSKICATSSSSSDEFSGTESMELIPTAEDLKMEKDSEAEMRRLSPVLDAKTEPSSDESICDKEPKSSTPIKDQKRADPDDCNISDENIGDSPSGRFTSLIMITSDQAEIEPELEDKSNVNIVTNSNTQLVQDKAEKKEEFKLTLNTEQDVEKTPHVSRSNSESDANTDEVKVVTGGDTLSAVICLEEGLADDDSWVEEIDHSDTNRGDYDEDDNFDDDNDNFDDDYDHYDDDDDDDDKNVGLMKNISDFQGHTEEELRGYHRSAIDFTLHTILEESCEEASEVEESMSNTKNNLENYFFGFIGSDAQLENSSGSLKKLDIGSIDVDIRDLDSISDTSSIFSEGLESFESIEQASCSTRNNKNDDEKTLDAADLASSRIEKYFLSSLIGNRRDSDGSVGSDSEGKPSPEQRRKKLVRARGTGRSYSNSLDNLTESEQQVEMLLDSESSSSETDAEELSFDKNDGFDTVKRINKNIIKKKRSSVTTPNLELLELDDSHPLNNEASIDEETKKVQAELYVLNADSRNKQQSRDSGFMGSCDDLLSNNHKEDEISANVAKEDEVKPHLESDSSVQENKSDPTIMSRTAPANSSMCGSGLMRKDSFNNWSSDEETNIMMSKMKQFFKTMIAKQTSSNAPASPKTPNVKAPKKPPQLLHFETELTRLMKTVPGIRDDQVKEIVEYLSSEDTWSDSYDSSDYTSSDLEMNNKSAQEGAGPVLLEGRKKDDTDLVYQRLVASFNRIDAHSQNSDSSSSHSSPPLITKVMQHIGSRLVALMHEVSSNDSHESSPKTYRSYHRRKQAMVTSDDESVEDFYALPRSKSHDPLLDENRQETSDNERFSWRGSFESALMTSSDSRQRLSSTGNTDSMSSSALALAAKRRSAGDLQMKSCSREQLDRVRSCGSIGGSVEDKIWNLKHSSSKKRRSSVPETTPSGGSADDDDSSNELTPSGKSTTLPRIVQASCAATNSLPRLPGSSNSASPSIYKAHSVHQFSVKSARYRPPGYGSRNSNSAVPPPRRDTARRRIQPSASASALSSPSIESFLLKLTNNQVVTPGQSMYGSFPFFAFGDDVSLCSEPGSGSRLSADEEPLSPASASTSPRVSLGARSDSLASVYSGAGESRYGAVTVKGEVEFGLLYNYKAGALEVHVKQCRDLAAVDTKRNRSDPYVKVYLLPDKSKAGKRKTKVKKHTLNPVFDEVLKFHINLEDLETRTMWLTIWHSDMFGRNDFLGEVMMPLENKIFDDPLPHFYPLQERSEPLEDFVNAKGEIIVALKFVPPDQGMKKRASKGTLHVLVKEAKNLLAVKNNGTSDPFCKSYLLPDKGKSNKQKTPVVRRSCSPAWNYTFTYPGVALTDLQDRAIELTIWDHDRLASNEFLGGVRLSLGSGKHQGKVVDWMDSNDKEATLWQQMLERPNFWVESCLMLRASLDLRNSG
nr:PREDICTED: uncharacterized protein LOC109031092 isoform X1 [Bemisia tabaci]XP_018897967.1 PREDICTED: uncharacterized protein LOC109031092 isoform X1 [Bemisia tabaci]